MDYSQENTKRLVQRRNSTGQRVKNKVGIIVFRVLLAVVLVGGFAAVGAGAGFYMGIIKNAPQVSVSVQPNIYTSVIYSDKTGAELDRLKGEENRIYVNIDQIPQYVKDAFVAIEDERFYTHNGIDFKGMVRAVVTVLGSKGGRMEGASTITQQLIKNNVRKLARNSFVTKLQEQYMAVQYEKELEKPENYGDKKRAKDHILEVYLNTINLAHGYYGIQTASKNYFDKDVSKLTLSEAAVIASITQYPLKYAPDVNPEANRERQTAILKNMLRLEMITQEEYDEAYADQVYDRIIKGASIEGDASIHDYFTDALVAQISTDLQDKYLISAAEASYRIYNWGLQIYSTQDMEMQGIIDDVINNDENYPEELYEIEVQYLLSVKNGVTGKLENYSKKTVVAKQEDVEPQIQKWRNDLLKTDDVITGERSFAIPQPQAGFIIIDYHTGEVKAMSGGRGDKTADRLLNRAVDSERGPGSVFKVLASYAPAIDLGLVTPSTIIIDEPFSYGGKEFRNWWGASYKGAQTVRRGIIESMNILSVKNMLHTGLEVSFDYLKNFGFKTLVDKDTRNGMVFSDIGPSTALGGLTDGVKQIELAAAMGTIANGGEYVEPILYTKVLDHDGNLLLESVPERRQVLKKTSAYLLTDMMVGVIRDPKGTGGKAAFKDSAMPVSGKTGTTTDSKDLTFTGFTPYYVASIWTGYDYSKEMDSKNQSFHTNMWGRIMERIHADLDIKEFEKPEGIVSASVCTGSYGDFAVSKLATDLCRNDARGNMVRTDIFASGDQPTDYCDVHVSIKIDQTTGMKAGSYCPSSSIATVIGVVVDDAHVTDRTYQIPSSVYNGSECYYHGPNAIDQLPNIDSEIYIDENGVLHAPDGPTTDVFDPVNGDSGAAPLSTPRPTPTPVPEYNGNAPNGTGSQTNGTPNDVAEPIIID